MKDQTRRGPGRPTGEPLSSVRGRWIAVTNWHLSNFGDQEFGIRHRRAGCPCSGASAISFSNELAKPQNEDAYGIGVCGHEIGTCSQLSVDLIVRYLSRPAYGPLGPCGRGRYPCLPCQPYQFGNGYPHLLHHPGTMSLVRCYFRFVWYLRGSYYAHPSIGWL